MPWHHLAECAVAAQARFRNVEAALEVVSLRLPSSLETSPADRSEKLACSFPHGALGALDAGQDRQMKLGEVGGLNNLWHETPMVLGASCKFLQPQSCGLE